MNRIDNPYNIHALHGYYNPWEHGRECPLYCGTSALPPTQLRLAASASGASFTGAIVNIDSGYSLDISSDWQKVCTGGDTFFTYYGDTLSPVLDEGTYQMKLVVNGVEYWGYPYCALSGFESGTPILNVSPSSSGAGNYTHNYSITNEKPGWAYLYEYNIGSGWVQFGGATGTITQADWGESGTITGYIRLSAFRGHQKAYRLYSVSFNVATPTLIIPAYEGEGGSGADGWAYVRWSNTKDLQNHKIYYAGGYSQLFYFRAEPGFSVPVLQDNFVENGENGLFLEGGITAEQVVVDFYPLPPHAGAVLSSIRIHDTVSVNGVWNLGTDPDIANFQFSPSTVENAACQAGRFTWERNRQYIGGCQEDYTTQSCS